MFIALVEMSSLFFDLNYASENIANDCMSMLFMMPMILLELAEITLEFAVIFSKLLLISILLECIS